MRAQSHGSVTVARLWLARKTPSGGQLVSPMQRRPRAGRRHDVRRRSHACRHGAQPGEQSVPASTAPSKTRARSAGQSLRGHEDQPSHSEWRTNEPSRSCHSTPSDPSEARYDRRMPTWSSCSSYSAGSVSQVKVLTSISASCGRPPPASGASSGMRRLRIPVGCVRHGMETTPVCGRRMSAGMTRSTSRRCSSRAAKRSVAPSGHCPSAGSGILALPRSHHAEPHETRPAARRAPFHPPLRRDLRDSRHSVRRVAPDGAARRRHAGRPGLRGHASRRGRSPLPGRAPRDPGVAGRLLASPGSPPAPRLARGRRHRGRALALALGSAPPVGQAGEPELTRVRRMPRSSTAPATARAARRPR